MELHKLKMNEIKGFDSAKLFETEKLIRKDMAMMGMDIYSNGMQKSSVKKGLKKALARIETAKSGLPAKTSK